MKKTNTRYFNITRYIIADKSLFIFKKLNSRYFNNTIYIIIAGKIPFTNKIILACNPHVDGENLFVEAEEEKEIMSISVEQNLLPFSATRIRR